MKSFICSLSVHKEHMTRKMGFFKYFEEELRGILVYKWERDIIISQQVHPCNEVEKYVVTDAP
jgi:hypothetical protein